jgi:hypothetical protein
MSIVSIRVKTQAAADDRWPTPFWSRPEKLHGKTISLPITTPPIWTKPEHISTPLHLISFAEPESSAEEIDMWRNKYTKDGQFKKIQYTNEFNRLQKMVSKRKFKAYYPSKQVEKGYTGILLGKAYQGQLQVPPSHNPSKLQAIFPTRIDSEQVIWTSSIRPLEPPKDFVCPVWLIPQENVEWIRPLKGAGGLTVSDLGLTLHGQLRRDPTIKEERNAEQLLKDAEDYDSQLHAELGPSYQYNYRYYPGDREFCEIFATSRNTLMSNSKSESEPKRDIRADWNTAIRVTFGHLKDGDVPPSGFYVIHRMSEQATTRVYLFLPDLSLEPDAWDEEEEPLYWTEEGGLESPVPLGKSEILAAVREAAAKVRSKQVNEMTIRRNLGKLALYGSRQDITHIRFYWRGSSLGGRLAWELGDTNDLSVDTSDVSVSACF